MAIGTKSDLTIYNEQYYAGYTEVMAQNVDALGQASRGAITVEVESHIGDYIYESFMAEISGLATRRDVTSVSAQTATAITMGQNIGVRLARKLKLVRATQDSFRQIGKDDEHVSFNLGQQAAKDVLRDMLHCALLAATQALLNQSSQTYDATNGTIEIEDLVQTQFKLDDAYSNIALWVFHPKVYKDLMLDHIAGQITNVADLVIREGTNATLGIPSIVTKDTALYLDATTDLYYTLGLLPGAIRLRQDGPIEYLIERVGGLENIVYSYQADYAYFMNLRGFQWDVSNGGANPSDATLSTGSNWDQAASDDRNLAGVVCKSQ